MKTGRSAQYQASVAAVPVAVREAAFVEAADCFCALLGRAEVRWEACDCPPRRSVLAALITIIRPSWCAALSSLCDAAPDSHHCCAAQAGDQLLRALAALWAVPAEAVQQYAMLHKPALQAGAADLSVGRATLPLLDAAAGRQALAAAAGGADGKVGAAACSAVLLRTSARLHFCLSHRCC